MLDVPSGTQGMLDEALDRMKTQVSPIKQRINQSIS